MKRGFAVGVMVSGFLLAGACRSGGRQGEVERLEKEAEQRAKVDEAAAGGGEGDALLDPLSANAGCYVCHMTFVGEALATTHLKAKVYCAGCHGASEGHANDEDVGATPPDIVIQRGQINVSCRKCHATHDVAPEQVVARWLEGRRLKSASQPAAGPSTVCTDCHGEHRIVEG